MASGYVFTNNNRLVKAVNLLRNNELAATATYGDINTWDVSGIKDFRNLFRDETTFNSDISNWDVSNGTKFLGCSKMQVHLTRI